MNVRYTYYKAHQPAVWIPCPGTRHLNDVLAVAACAYTLEELAGIQTQTTILIPQLWDQSQTQNQHLFFAGRIKGCTAVPPGLRRM